MDRHGPANRAINQPTDQRAKRPCRRLGAIRLAVARPRHMSQTQHWRAQRSWRRAMRQVRFYFGIRRQGPLGPPQSSRGKSPRRERGQSSTADQLPLASGSPTCDNGSLMRSTELEKLSRKQASHSRLDLVTSEGKSIHDFRLTGQSTATVLTIQVGGIKTGSGNTRRITSSANMSFRCFSLNLLEGQNHIGALHPRSGQTLSRSAKRHSQATGRCTLPHKYAASAGGSNLPTALGIVCGRTSRLAGISTLH